MSYYSCVIYFSLPSFPKNCKLISKHNVAVRDLLLCSRINDHHINGGMQYDPNIENGEYRVCEGRIRRGLQRRMGKYDNLYILFRTRYFDLNGDSKYLVTGYYRVGEIIQPEYSDTPIVRAADRHFVSLDDSIDITSVIQEKQAFRCCPGSENRRWRPYLEDWFKQLNDSPDRTEEYSTQINALKEIFRENDANGGNYASCSDCAEKMVCPLMWRLNHRKIDPHPANYMKSLDEYYKSVSPEDRTPIT